MGSPIPSLEAKKKLSDEGGKRVGQFLAYHKVCPCIINTQLPDARLLSLADADSDVEADSDPEEEQILDIGQFDVSMSQLAVVEGTSSSLLLLILLGDAHRGLLTPSQLPQNSSQEDFRRVMHVRPFSVCCLTYKGYLWWQPVWRSGSR